MTLKKTLIKYSLILFFFIGSIYIQAQTPVQVAGVATKTAIKSGNWSNPSTWNGNAIPGDLARVLIPNNITVTIDGMIPQEMKSVRIASGGKLQYATNTNTELRTEYLVSEMGGEFEIGTSTNPVNAANTASLVFAEKGGTSKAQDKFGFAPGAVLMGKVRMYGAPKTSWLKLQVQPTAGTNQLVLSTAPTGWRVDDKIVVAGTDPNSYTSDEMVKIASISGNTVTLTKNLALNHQAPPEIASLVDVHVSNNTRNIVISSEDTRTESIGQNGYHKPRGHMMFMHNADVVLKYVEAINTGRTDKSIELDDWDSTGLPRPPQNLPEIPDGFKNPRGRYSFHFHRSIQFNKTMPDYTITPPAATVEGCVVNNDPGWGYVNHSSHVNFLNNVSYEVLGAAFSTESGNELGSFKNNIAIRTVNPSLPMNVGRPNEFKHQGGNDAVADVRENRSDFAWQGDGFWFHSTGVTVEGNVVSGASGHAFVYWAEGLVENKLGIAKGDINIHCPASEFKTLNTILNARQAQFSNWNYDIWYLRTRPCRNNIAYSMARGIHGYYVMTRFHEDAITDSQEYNLPPQEYINANVLTIENNTLWSMRRVGIGFTHCAQISLKNNKVYGYGTSTALAPWNITPNPFPGLLEDEPAVLGMDLDHSDNYRTWNIENNTVKGFNGQAIAVTLPINASSVVVNGGTFDNGGIDLRIREVNSRRDAGDFLISDTQPWPSSNTPWRTMEIKGNINFMNSNKNIVIAPQFHLNNPNQDGFSIDSGGLKVPAYFLLPDLITLNFGPFNNSKLYFNEQISSFTPSTNQTKCPLNNPNAAKGCTPTNLVNKTNQQLMASVGLSFRREILPSNAVDHPMITGGKVPSNTLSANDYGFDEIKISPNPVTDRFNITFPNNENDQKQPTVLVYDLMGRLISRSTVTVQNRKISIPFSGYSQGLYMVSIFLEGKTKSVKIIKE